MKDRTTPISKWLAKLTIASNFNYTDHEIAIDIQVLYELFQVVYPTLFKKKCYFLRAVKLYAKKIKGNPKVVEMNEIYYIVLGLKSDRTPVIVSDINDNRIKSLKSEMCISDRILDCIPAVSPTKTPTNIATNTSLPTIPPPLPPPSPPPPPSPSVTSTPKQRQLYPMMNSLGINTNIDKNKDQLSQLLREITMLYKNSKQRLEFLYLNSKPGILLPIPTAKNFSTFDKNKKRERWIEQCFDFINSTSTHTLGSDTDACYWMLKYLYKQYPETFIAVAKDVGIHVVNKMTNIEAAAMWVEANISYRSARIILKHLHAKFKFRVQVPFNQIQLLSDVLPALNPTFHKFNFKKNNEETKVGELVKYWTISPAQLIETDFSRLLSSKSKYHNITFKYKLQSSHGVNCLVRADHGAGKSRYLVRVNYLPSSARCQKN